MSEVRQYSIQCSGDARFFREAGVSLCDVVEHVLDDEGWSKVGLLDVCLFPVKKGPQADAFMPAVIGFLLFVGSWAASKMLDEVYTLKLQPKLRQWLLKADEIVVFGNKNQKRIFSVSIYYADLGIVVMVALIGDSYAMLTDEKNAVQMLQLKGLEWARQHPGSGPVYLYVVKNGSSNGEPMEFDNVDKAGEIISNNAGDVRMSLRDKVLSIVGETMKKEQEAKLKRRSDSKSGLTVRVNLWPSSEIHGVVVHPADKSNDVHFKNVDELIGILGACRT